MIVSGIESAVDLALASTTGCGVQADGKLLCWADYTAQMLRPSVPGSGGDGPRPEPLIARFPLVTDAKSVTASRASYATFCVLTRTHEVTCLQSERDSVPADPKTLQLPDDVEVIAPSDTHVCALRKGGKLGCWKGEPTGFEVLLEGVQMLSAGSAYNCVVDGSNDVLCWGSNSLGQSGRGSASPTSSIDSPTRVDGLPKIARVRAGIHHTCAVAQTGSVHCWGDNRFGQLGSPHGAVQNVRNAEDVALGEWHSCALIRGGAIRCWGRNHRGQLGDGTNVERAEAKPVTAVVPP
jgi:hypothetical protein